MGINKGGVIMTFEINIVWFVILIFLASIGGIILLIILLVWLFYLISKIVDYIEWRHRDDE